MARGTNLLFIVLAFSALCQVSKARQVSPCDGTQELFGDVNLTKAFEESDLVALGSCSWNNTHHVFKTYRPYNYKDVEVPKEIVIDGYNCSHNVAIFLTKTQESSFKLYSQNDEEVKPLKLNLTQPFLNCVNYLSLEDQEPQIVVENHLQKAWGSPEGKYYFENGTNVTLQCNGRTQILKSNSKWFDPSGQLQSAIDLKGRFEAQEEGNYTCGFYMDDRKSRLASVVLEALGENFIMLELAADNSTLEVHDQGDDTEEMEWRINFLAYPKNITFSWEHKGRALSFNCSKVEEGKRHVECDYQKGTLTLKLKRPSVLEAGTHSLMVSVWKNGTSLRQKTLQRRLVVWDHELDVNLSLETLEGKDIPKDHILEKDQQFHLKCYVTGHPVSDVLLEFRSCDSLENCSSPNLVNGKVVMKSSNLTSTVGPKLRIWQESAKVQGIYQCLGTNRSGEKFLSNHVILAISDCGQMTPISIEAKINVEESEQPVYVNSSSPVISVIIGDDVTLRCRKNKMSKLTDKLEWISQDFSFDQENITREQEEFSEVLVWKLDPDLLKYNGTIISCGSGGKRQIIVKEAKAPHFVKHESFKSTVERIGSLTPRTTVNFSCKATGVPNPIINWTKDDTPLKNNPPHVTIEGSTLKLYLIDERDSGVYKCSVSNRAGSEHDSVKLTVDTGHQPSAWIFIISICLCFMVLVLGSVAYNIRKKRKRSIFMIEEVEQFISGAPGRFNPELGFSQQAHLLPYERKFEIARQRIEFGKLIGEGEFGHVFQAKVDGLLPNERQTTVAVKTSKSRSNDVFRKELIAEVKIMMHIGRHANILNLLGVCSENLATKGELLVLVEYCRHGNLRDYLVRHRKNFVQDRDASSHCSHSYGKAASTVYAELRKDDGLSSQDTSSVVESRINKERSLDSSSAIIASTLNTVELSIQEPSNPLFISGAADPAPSIYSDGMTQENLAPADLVSWSYQIAKGMEYLSLRKVVHGDLAARNILLDESYTVKISDFGFAKDVYHKNYKKKGQTSCLMPVKWMSPEYLKDEIRSIQSDVWAYGVLLWEIFSLGESPYQGFFLDETFVEKIEKGYRLPCPKYSPEKVYKMMLDCWQIEPMDRPPFSDLVKRMIRLLSSREREYFESMNQPYDEQIMSTFLASLITPNYVNLTSTQKRNPAVDLDPEVLSVTYTHVSAPQTCSPMTKRTNLSIASISLSSDSNGEDDERGDGYLCMNPVNKGNVAPN
ncbi:vascular endothelial growth factor receptor 1-like [Macrobrachium nipponense]|uniref:vascular endothelial growth factor receptor 1-like n=1 Tax=Macrobrachium nipponense TaxID=159736 RepID=UPI0030C87D49